MLLFIPIIFGAWLVRPETTSRDNFFFNIIALAAVAQLVAVPSHTPKGCRFDSRSGHLPRLQVWSLVGLQMEGNQSMFLSHFSLSPSPSLSLSFSLSNEKMCSDEDTNIYFLATCFQCPSNSFRKCWIKLFRQVEERLQWQLRPQVTQVGPFSSSSSGNSSCPVGVD